MEKVELKKKLEKKKAHLVCLMIFLVLSTPTFVGFCRELNVSNAMQIAVLGGILMIISYIYKKMNQVRTQIKTIR